MIDPARSLQAGMRGSLPRLHAWITSIGRSPREIRRFVVTHAHPDHIGGAPSVIGEFRPHEVWEGVPVPRFAPLTALRLQAQAAGAKWANEWRRSTFSP